MLTIDRLSGKPVYEQIIDQIEGRISAGILRPGDPIPSVRSLSLELSGNPNTIQKAYAELELRKITGSVPGVGRFVAADAREKIAGYYNGRLSELYDAAAGFARAGVAEEKVLDTIRRAYRETVPYPKKEDDK